MEEITENILLDNGFTNDNHYGFSYSTNYYIIDILCSARPIKDRVWFCVVYTSDMHDILATTLIQTIDQFNNLMDMTGVDFRLKNYSDTKKWNKTVNWKHLGLSVLYTAILACIFAVIIHLSIEVFLR